MTVTPERIPGHLDAVVGEAMEQVRDRLAAKGILLDPQIAAGIPEHPIDPALLREALVLLLDAAIDTADTNARMRVTVKASPSALMVAIKSPGSGLSRSEREQLFDGDEAARPLARARSIVGAHGGRVWANGRQGRGLTYYLTLDCRKSAAEHE